MWDKNDVMYHGGKPDLRIVKWFDDLFFIEAKTEHMMICQLFK